VLSEESKEDQKGAEDQISLGNLVETPEDGGGTIANGRASRQKAARSLNSSEIEFAGAGY